jgi:predicted phage terminase large subunit-like protein
VSYSWERAKAVAAETRHQADRARLVPHGLGTADHWPLPAGGSCRWVGIGGGLTGFPVDVLITDDTLKDREAAESRTQRDRVWGWYQGVAFDRLQKGASIIHIETRWHVDDITSRLLALSRSSPDAYQFEHVSLPALDADGNPLAPQLHSAESLRRKRAQVGPYEWSAKYLGDPRPRGQELFTAPFFTDHVPTDRVRYSIGVDLAYSAKTQSDYSAAVVLATDHRGLHHVVEVLHRQCSAPDFAAELATVQERYGGAVANWYAPGPEVGVADLMRGYGARVAARRPVGDKYQRALPAAAAWREGQILVPRRAPWLNAFLDEVTAFSGVGDRYDDQVDALSAAYDAAVAGGGLMTSTRSDTAGW